MTTTHAARTHSSISPSKLKSLEISPAYQSDPDDPEHPITAEGTLCHEALDSGNDSRLETDDQREWVRLCREYTAEVLPGGTAHNEVKLDVLDGIWGYADQIMYLGRKAALIDYKFGWNQQEDTETNPAAQAYVFGMFSVNPGVGEVSVHYLYPRIGQVSTAKYTRADIPRIETRIRLIVEKARDAKPETCRWSPESTSRWPATTGSAPLFLVVGVGLRLVEAAPDPVTDPSAQDNTVAGTPGRPLGNELTAAEWRIARLSPLLLDEWEQAEGQGWRITAEAGIGTFTRHGDKVINIDPGLAAEGPTHRVNALAHELGHALYQPEVDRRTRDGYVTSYLDGEGAAVWNGIRIEREILAAGGADIIPPNHNDDYFERIYDAAGEDPQSYRDAIHQIGQVYADLTPSNDVTKNYRDYYSGEYRCSFLRGLIGKCERP